MTTLNKHFSGELLIKFLRPPNAYSAECLHFETTLSQVF